MDSRPQQLAPEQPTQPREPSGDGALGYDESWLSSLLRPLLIFVLVLCINIALLVLLEQYAAGLGAGVRWAILALGVVAAVIGVTSTTWLAHPDQRLRRTAGYRIAEIVLILLVSRVVLWLAQGSLPSLDAFMLRPDEVFLDGPYLLTLLVLLFTWFAAIDFTDDLAQLGLQPDELHVAQTARSGVFDSSRPVQGDRRAILRRIVARWVGWGIVLIFIASALRMGVTRERFWTLARQDVHPLVIAVIVIYFLCGLLLLSQGQLAVLRARWTIDGLPTSGSILRNWPIYTAAVLLVTAFVALFLPLGDTLLISRVLSFVLDAIYHVVTLIFQLISLVLILLFSLLPRSQQLPPPQPTPEAVAAAPPTPPMLEIPPWFGGALFWTTILFILALAAYFYFTDRETNMRWLRKLRDMLSARWQQLRGSWRAWRRSVQMRDASSLGTAITGAATSRKWWPLQWGGLNPEQQVRYLYFQLLNRAAEYDKGRLESETPTAYAPRLSEEVDAQAEDREAIEALTKAFVQVRYAGQAARQEQVSWLAQLWDHLRKVFSSQP
ncbi:MAG: DUF4129 domain-containing protein [Caldilineaceae bacterium]